MKLDKEKLTTKTPQSTHDSYIWADYFELNTLLEHGEALNDEDFYQYILKGKDFSTDKDDITPAWVDKQKSLIQDGLKNVLLRKSILKEKYPFEYDDYKKEIKLKKKLSNIHYTYLSLLISSNLRYLLKKSDEYPFTGGFEKICLDTIKVLYPNAVIKLFGSSNLESTLLSKDKYNENKLKERIKSLAKDICQPHWPDVDVIEEQNLGDEGLDVVGFIDLKDNRGSFPLFFVQCACSKEDWVKKQSSTHRDTWDYWLDLRNTSVQHLVMVPFPFMNYDKSWLKKQDIKQNIMIDRIRIINILENKYCSKLDCFAHINKILIA